MFFDILLYTYSRLDLVNISPTDDWIESIFMHVSIVLVIWFVLYLVLMFWKDKELELWKCFLGYSVFLYLILPVGVTAYVMTMAPQSAYDKYNLDKATKALEEEKIAIEEKHKREILKAQHQVKLAEIKARRLKLHQDSAKRHASSKELAKARADLQKLQKQGADYSEMSVGSTPQSPSEPENEQTKLILSALWLGACFFLQRIFEKYFEDKGYALLAVCALGFLIAFFSANYFLLGGSVTGGLMGSAGDRG